MFPPLNFMLPSELHDFIIKNSKSIKKRSNQSVKPGIHHLKLFDEIDSEQLYGDDLIEYLYVAYKIKNSNHVYKRKLIQKAEHIDNPFLKTIIFCELNLLNSAVQVIDQLTEHFCIGMEIIGAEAKFKEYNEIINDAMFIEIKDMEGHDSIKNRVKYKFETEKCIFTEQKVVALNVNEQKICILIIFYILKLYEIENNKKEEHFEFANAFLDRLLFLQNESFTNKEYILNYFRNVLRSETNEITFFNKYDKEIPFIPAFDYFKTLADNYFKKYNFESSLHIYTILEQHLKMIKCYLGMNKEDEMTKELNKIKLQLEKKLHITDGGHTPDTEDVSSGKTNILHIDEVKKQLNCETNNNIADQEKCHKPKDQKEEQFRISQLEINTMEQVSSDSTGVNHQDSNLSAKKVNHAFKGTDINEMTKSEMKFTLINTYSLLAEICKDPSYYDKAYVLFETHETLKNKALYFIRENRLREAILLLEKALEHCKNDLKLYHMLGCLKIATNMDGEKYLQKILELDPDNYDTLLNLSDLKIQQGENADALVFLKQAFKIHQNENIAKSIVALLAKEERKEELEQFLRENNALVKEEQSETNTN